MGVNTANFSIGTLCPNVAHVALATPDGQILLIDLVRFTWVGGQIILLMNRPVAAFAQQRLRYQGYHGKAFLWAHLCRRENVLYLLQA